MLAKADVRSRKQKLALEKAQDAYRELHGTILKKISHKHQRKNEMIQQSNLVKQNALFLKAIYFINFASRLEQRYRETYTLHQWKNFQNRSATRYAVITSIQTLHMLILLFLQNYSHDQAMVSECRSWKSYCIKENPISECLEVSANLPHTSQENSGDTSRQLFERLQRAPGDKCIGE